MTATANYACPECGGTLERATTRDAFRCTNCGSVVYEAGGGAS